MSYDKKTTSQMLFEWLCIQTFPSLYYLYLDERLQKPRYMRWEYRGNLLVESTIAYTDMYASLLVFLFTRSVFQTLLAVFVHACYAYPVPEDAQKPVLQFGNGKLQLSYQQCVYSLLGICTYLNANDTFVFLLFQAVHVLLFAPFVQTHYRRWERVFLSSPERDATTSRSTTTTTT